MSDTIENKAVKLSDLTSVTQLIKDYTDEKDTNKVDKIEGKSLLDDTEIERLKGVNNYDDTEVKENIAEVKTDVTKLSSQIDEKANLLNARIDNLATLTEGSTTGDAELIDIRVGVDGTTYANAGEAVRGQINLLNNNITENRGTNTNIVSTTWTNGKSVIATVGHVGEIGNSSMLSLSDYIDLTNADKLTFNVPIYEFQTSYGYVLYDKDKIAIKGVQFRTGGIYDSEKITIDVSNYSYIRTCWYTDTIKYGEFSATTQKISLGGLKSYVKGQDIIVAASDSNEFDKMRSDYICTGTNDEKIIQKAMDNIGATGTCWLCGGNYNIDSFVEADDGGQPYAIRFRLNNQSSNRLKGFNFIPQRKKGGDTDIVNCAVLNVTQACYDSLDDTTVYTIIRAECVNGKRSYPSVGVNVNGIGIKLPDNQKNIIGIDGYYASSMDIKNILGNAIYSGANLNSASTLHIGAENCIGIRGMQGSNFGTANQWKSCFMWGFGTAYDCSGEHLELDDLGSRVSNYPFKFRSTILGAGYLVHPMTMINCCSEMDFNYPYFDQNVNRQALNIIGFNIEHYPNHFALSGNYATEKVPGQWRGTINYTIQDFGNITGDGDLKNSRSARFWAEGNGHGMVSKNDAQLEGGITYERTTYGANYMQKYFDIDLNKLLIYTGDKWVDTNGTVISTSVKSIEFTKKNLTIAVGETVATSYTILPENATNKDITYKNTDSSVSSINVNTGIITGKAVGTNKITIISKDSAYIDTVTVTVTE